jgi:hypothetical protein
MTLPSDAPVTTQPEPKKASGKVKDSRIAYWKTCQFCHHSFEHLEQHLRAKRSKCSRDPEGQPWSAAQIKGLVNTSKKTMETNQKSKQYYSAIKLKTAIREAGTLHKLSTTLFELTGVFFDTTEVEDCKVLLQYSQKPSESAAPSPMPQSAASADHELAVPPKQIARPTQKRPVRASQSAAIVDSQDVAAPSPTPQSAASVDHEPAVPPKQIARPTKKRPVRASRSAAIVDSPDVDDAQDLEKETRMGKRLRTVPRRPDAFWRNYFPTRCGQESTSPIKPASDT